MRRWPGLAILFPLSLCLVHCAHLVQTREDYAITGDEPTVNGARLSGELLTTDGMVNYSLSAMVYFVAGETETGPYKCLLTAWGKKGHHRWMSIDRLVFRTQRGDREAAPVSGQLPFAPGANDQGWQSTYVVPGVLELDYEVVGEITVEALVTIQTRSRKRQRRVDLTFVPAESRNVRFASVIDEFQGDHAAEIEPIENSLEGVNLP